MKRFTVTFGEGQDAMTYVDQLHSSEKEMKDYFTLIGCNPEAMTNIESEDVQEFLIEYANEDLDTAKENGESVIAGGKESTLWIEYNAEKDRYTFKGTRQQLIHHEVNRDFAVKFLINIYIIEA